MEMHYIKVEPLTSHVILAQSTAKARSTRDALGEVLTYIQDSEQYTEDLIGASYIAHLPETRTAVERVETLQALVFHGVIARSMLTCGACGLEVASKHHYCPWCGRRLEGTLRLTGRHER